MTSGRNMRRFLMAVLMSFGGVSLPAAAAAGGGWYLLYPRVTPGLFRIHDTTLPIVIEMELPLSKWMKSAAYDSAAACEQGRRALQSLSAILTLKELPGDSARHGRHPAAGAPGRGHRPLAAAGVR
jgi:hypothetical protein